MRVVGDRGWALLAAAVMVVTFGIQLGLVGWNRSAETARLELGAGGVELPWPSERHEGQPLAFRLRVEAPQRLSRAELVDLGFAIEEWKGEEPPRPPVSRRAWLVLDASPEAWQAFLRGRAAEVRRLREQVARGERDEPPLAGAEDDLERLREGPPRPVIVAAGRDREALRRRFPDHRQQAVVAGTVTPIVTGQRGREAWHSIVLTVGEVSVPPRLHRTVQEMIEERGRQRTGGASGVFYDHGQEIDPAHQPPFRAVIAWGRRHEPWLVSFEPVATPPPSPP